MNQKLLSIILVLFVVFQVESQSVGMLGDFNGWGNDVMLSTTDGSNFTLSGYTFTVSGGVKFRENMSWSVNWGGTSFPSGTASLGGANIPVPAGTYNIAFNRDTGAYSFTAVSSGFDDIGFIGGFNSWAESVPMVTTNGDIYTKADFYFAAPDVKFRKDNSWSVSWGGSTFPMGTAILNGDNIPLTPGYYNVNFNNASLTYNFQIVPVTIIGPAVQDWNTEVAMISTDGGISFTLENITLNAGEMKFRANNAWALNWGGTTFPSGTAAPNSVDETPITVEAGTYNVSFNRLTLSYNFQNTLSVESFEATSIQVVPNPAKSDWNISSTQLVEQVVLFDMTGKTVYRWNGNTQELQISNTSLAPGMYMAKIITGQQEKVVKLIKQ